MKRAFSILGWLVLCVLLAGVSYRKVLAVKANSLVVAFTLDHRDKSDRYASRFLAAKLDWKRIALFNPPIIPVQRDAGEWLNRRVTWLPAGTSRGSGSVPRSAMVKGFAGSLRDGKAFVAGTEKMASWLDDWAAHFSEIFPPGKIPFADFSWMSGLNYYTYWDVDSSEQVRTALSLNTKLLAEELPEPSWSELETWVQLRLLHGIAMRNLGPALSDSRTVIRLLISTERMNALRTAVRLLKRESQALRVYQSRVDPKFNGLPGAFPPEQLPGLEGYLLALPGLLDSATDPEVLTDAFQADGVVLGLCAALNSLSPRILRDRVLLSDAYAYGVEALGRILKDPGNRCRVPRLKSLWDRPDYLPEPLSSPKWEPPPIPGLPGFLAVSTWFDFHIRTLDNAALDALPSPLRGSSAVRRAVGIVLKQSDEPGDPWSYYARQK